FFFSSRRRHTRFSRDWSSDVCSSDLNGVYGPGHNYFVKSKDGTQDWIVYHGNNNPGEGCGARPSRMQEVNWNADATPDFGIPTKIGRASCRERVWITVVAGRLEQKAI